MSKNTSQIDKIKLNGTKDGLITVSVIEEPYGANSESVASIGITLKADASEPEWKVHIPKANIEEVIAALQEANKNI